METLHLKFDTKLKLIKTIVLDQLEQKGWIEHNKELDINVFHDIGVNGKLHFDIIDVDNENTFIGFYGLDENKIKKSNLLEIEKYINDLILPTLIHQLKPYLKSKDVILSGDIH